MAKPGLPIEQLRALSRVSAAAGAADLVKVWGGIAAAIGLACWLRSVWAVVAAGIFVGLRQGALANLAHDAWHRLCFPGARLNDAVGAWLYAYPIGLPYHHDRVRHLQHHRLVGHAEDPDWRNYRIEGRGTPGRLAGYLLANLAGGLLLDSVLSILRGGGPRIAVSREEVPDGRADGSRLGTGGEMLRVVVVQAVLASILTLAGGWWAYPALWLLPLSTVCAFCVSVRALVEHMAHSDDVAPAERLRDIDAGPVEHFVFSPCHFHFHALHHANPSIPHYRLPAAKKALIEARGGYEHAVAPGYVRSLAGAFAEMKRPRETAG